MSKPMSEQMQKVAERYEKATGKKFDQKTNADRIRSMSDEELVSFFLKLLLNNIPCFGEEMFPYHPCPQDHDCHKCGLDWLKQPYKEDT